MKLLLLSTTKSEQQTNENAERLREDKEQNQYWLTQMSENMTRMQQNIVPQNIIHTNAPAPSLSKLTNDSTQLVIVTPPKPRAQKRSIDSQEAAATEDNETVNKYHKFNEDCSGATTATTGAESESDYNPHNGKDSVQRHDHQMGLGQQRH